MPRRTAPPWPRAFEAPCCVLPVLALAVSGHAWWAWLLVLAGLSALALAVRAGLSLVLARTAALHQAVLAANREIQSRDAALTEVRQALRASSEQKSLFIGMIGHDLRNPLNGIMLSSELLEDTSPDPAVTHLAQLIQAECRSMDNLIARFLDMAAIEAGTLKPVPVLCSLGDQARACAGRHQARAEEKGIQLSLNVDPRIPAVLADARFAQEILDSLVSNAVKFSPAGTTVTLGVGRHPGGVGLTIQDQGPGFTDADLARLYLPFTKLSARPSGNEKAVGLGLSLVKHMVEAMGCRISLATAPGQGAAFQILFPAEGE